MRGFGLQSSGHFGTTIPCKSNAFAYGTFFIWTSLNFETNHGGGVSNCNMVNVRCAIKGTIELDCSKIVFVVF